MLTLICSNLNILTASTSELVGGWITLVVDIICALILLFKAVRNKQVSLKDFLNLFGTNAGRKKLSNEIGKIISTIEKDEKPLEEDKQADETTKQDEVK